MWPNCAAGAVKPYQSIWLSSGICPFPQNLYISSEFCGIWFWLVIKNDKYRLEVTRQRHRIKATSAWSTESCSCFRSSTVAGLVQTLADFHFILNITAAVDEWQIYVDIATNQEMPEDVVALCCAVDSCFPKLAALAYIMLPVFSVDFERSFLKYGFSLNPLWQDLKLQFESIVLILFYNNWSDWFIFQISTF